jgi:Uma2 family endonuclease
MATEIQRARRLFTVDEYDRMVTAGVFGPDDRLELIEGEIIEMSPIGHRHTACVANLLKIFVSRLGERAVVWPPGAVRLSTRSKPEPDVTLLRPHSYRDAHPGVQDALLLIEVSDSSLAYDRGVKLALYARAGIPEYWIVDVDGRMVETFRTPTVGGYRETRRFARDEVIAPLSFPDVTFRVSELFA